MKKIWKDSMANGLVTRNTFTNVQDANARSKRLVGVHIWSALCATTVGVGFVDGLVEKVNGGFCFSTLFACFILKLYSGGGHVGK